MTLRSIALAASLCLASALATLAAPAPAEPDPLAELLFPPDVVLRHQGAIELSTEQRDELITEVTAAQGEFLRLQAELAAGGERLQSLLAATQIDEAGALDVAREMMALETRIKERHLQLAIRIKNLLSEEQQSRLAGLR